MNPIQKGGDLKKIREWLEEMIVLLMRKRP
jgi:hypothetical protein